MGDIVEVMARRICGWAFRVIERPIDPYVDDKYDREVATERVEEAMTAARSAIAALDAEGFAIVPKEPTEAMIKHGAYQVSGITRNGADAIYRAMLAASQLKGDGA